MPTDPRGDQPQLISALELELRRTLSLDAVLAAVVGVVGERFTLCRVSLRVVVPEAAEVEIVAVWSRRRSGLTRGTRMPLRSTTLAAVAATGRPQIGSNVQAADGLLHQLLGDEGIRSYASAPLGDVSSGAPVLSMSSSRPNGFTDADLSLVEAVSAVVAPHVKRLRGAA
ncbi:MAG TPA: GAF domain-containing protein [Mycobacteriales bacterium]|nr:GAF domain-containing protein [Mycobacteriales bacterium]